MIRVSVSDLLAFQKCPRYWKAKRIEHLEDQSRWSRIGMVCHSAAEQVTLYRLTSSQKPSALVAREEILRWAAQSSMPPDEMHEALEIMDKALAPDSAIRLVPEPGWMVTTEQEIDLDEKFEVVAGIGHYGGRLDRLQWNEALGLVEVVDWKTGQDWMSSEDVADDEQAQWYANLALALFPQAPSVTFRRVMLRLGYTASHEFARDGAWQTRIRDRMWRCREAIVAVHGEGMAEEKVGGHCRFCPRAGVCDGLKRAVAIGQAGVVPTTMPREEVARLRAALRGFTEELTEVLRADCEANGPIPLGDGTVLGFHAEKRSVLRDGDIVRLKQRLRDLGMNAGIEEKHFAPSERALPGVVKAVLGEIVPKKAKKAYEEELLAPATGFSFETKKERV